MSFSCGDNSRQQGGYIYVYVRIYTYVYIYIYTAGMVAPTVRLYFNEARKPVTAGLPYMPRIELLPFKSHN